MRLSPITAGVGLALLTIGGASALPKPYAHDTLTLLLVAIAAIYVGFAVSDGRPQAIVTQSAVALIFVFIGVISLQGTPFLLAVGYFAHGLWDWLHHRRYLDTHVVTWWPPFCVIYDWIVAGFILLWW